MTGRKGFLKAKSYAFAIRIVKMTQYLQEEKHEHVLSKQVLRAGSAIGALIREAEFAQSEADYINKLSISLKEANFASKREQSSLLELPSASKVDAVNETDYWLTLLHDTKYIDDEAHNSIESDCKELIALLVTTIKTLKSKTAK